MMRLLGAGLVACVAARSSTKYAGTDRLFSEVVVVVTNENGRLMQAMTGQPKGR